MCLKFLKHQHFGWHSGTGKRPKLVGVEWKTGHTSWTWIHINLDKLPIRWLLEECIIFLVFWLYPKESTGVLLHRYLCSIRFFALLIDLDSSSPGPSTTMSPEHLIPLMPVLRTCCFLVLALLLFIGIVIGSFSAVNFDTALEGSTIIPGENRNELGIELIDYHIHSQVYSTTNHYSLPSSLSDILYIYGTSEYRWI